MSSNLHKAANSDTKKKVGDEGNKRDSSALQEKKESDSNKATSSKSKIKDLESKKENNKPKEEKKEKDKSKEEKKLSPATVKDTTESPSSNGSSSSRLEELKKKYSGGSPTTLTESLLNKENENRFNLPRKKSSSVLLGKNSNLKVGNSEINTTTANKFSTIRGTQPPASARESPKPKEEVRSLSNSTNKTPSTIAKSKSATLGRNSSLASRINSTRDKSSTGGSTNKNTSPLSKTTVVIGKQDNSPKEPTNSLITRDNKPNSTGAIPEKPKKVKSSVKSEEKTIEKTKTDPKQDDDEAGTSSEEIIEDTPKKEVISNIDKREDRRRRSLYIRSNRTNRVYGDGEVTSPGISKTLFNAMESIEAARTKSPIPQNG